MLTQRRKEGLCRSVTRDIDKRCKKELCKTFLNTGNIKQSIKFGSYFYTRRLTELIPVSSTNTPPMFCRVSLICSERRKPNIHTKLQKLRNKSKTTRRYYSFITLSMLCKLYLQLTASLNETHTANCSPSAICALCICL
jgi:hypothetical protein